MLDSGDSWISNTEKLFSALCLGKGYILMLRKVFPVEHDALDNSHGVNTLLKHPNSLQL
jgi:hypothetical protein